MGHAAPDRSGCHYAHAMRRRTLLVLPVGLVLSVLAAWWIPRGGTTLESTPAEPTEAAASVAAPDPPPRVLETVQVQPRETLLTLLRRLHLDGRSAHVLVQRLKETGLNPRTIRARDLVELERDAAGAIAALNYAPSAWLRFEGRMANGEWRARRVDVQPEVRVEVREGRIERSLWDAVESGAVDAQTVLDLVSILSLTSTSPATLSLATASDCWSNLITPTASSSRWVASWRHATRPTTNNSWGSPSRSTGR